MTRIALMEMLENSAKMAELAEGQRLAGSGKVPGPHDPFWTVFHQARVDGDGFQLYERLASWSWLGRRGILCEFDGNEELVVKFEALLKHANR